MKKNDILPLEESRMRFHGFEFMDTSWVPAPLRQCLRDVLEVCNSTGLRPYNSWLASQLEIIANDTGSTRLIELGSGNAPLTRSLLQNGRGKIQKISPCDLYPDHKTYKQLQSQFPEIVEPIYESIDFSLSRQWPNDSILVLSATHHHLEGNLRRQVVQALFTSNRPVVIAEPLRHNLISILSTFFTPVFTLMTPIALWRRPGGLHRVLWCWLFPIAAPLFIWDGIISALRSWTDEEWEENLESINLKGQAHFHRTLLTTVVVKKF
jgi:hypothetical protein